jgi:hypothetical protein
MELKFEGVIVGNGAFSLLGVAPGMASEGG